MPTPVRTLALPVLLCGALLLAACDRNHETADRTVVQDDRISGSSITFNGDTVTLHRDNLPTATITAAGDLLIDGKAVTTTAAQRQAMIGYRKELHGITMAGIEIGKEGAKLGVDAAGEAIKGIFNGDTDKIGQKVEARAEQIKAKAKELCDNVERLRVAQDAAVAQVPQFKPYSKLEQQDVTECRAD
ncbi:MAG TPA: DUF2884 family protein [Stenotrophomonas sp.]|jgi:hypothetical protein